MTRLVFGDPAAIMARDAGRGRGNIKPMPVPPAVKSKEPKVYLYLTADELRWAGNLTACTFQVGCPDKRFVRSFPENGKPFQMTMRQIEYLHRLVYRYRRQLHMSDGEAKAVFYRLQAARHSIESGGLYGVTASEKGAISPR